MEVITVNDGLLTNHEVYKILEQKLENFNSQSCTEHELVEHQVRTLVSCVVNYL